MDCLKSEPAQNILCNGRNNDSARNTRSTFEYSSRFCDVTLNYMTGSSDACGRETSAPATGTSTPACKHGKKTISHIRFVILNKCLQLGI